MRSKFLRKVRIEPPRLNVKLLLTIWHMLGATGATTMVFQRAALVASMAVLEARMFSLDRAEHSVFEMGVTSALMATLIPANH